MVTIVKDVKKPEVYAGESFSKINITLDGLDKTGKSHFALTAPTPIAYHTFDRRGFVRAARAFPDLDVYPYYYEYAETATLPGTEDTKVVQEAVNTWKELSNNLLGSLSFAQTVVIDSGSKAWPLIRLARHGKLEKVPPLQYVQVNQEFDSLIQRLHNSKSNIIWIHRLEEEWKGTEKTGKFKRSGYSDIGFEVDCELVMSNSDKGGFQATFGNCGDNMKLKGTSLTGSDITFDNVISKIFEKN